MRLRYLIPPLLLVCVAAGGAVTAHASGDRQAAFTTGAAQLRAEWDRDQAQGVPATSLAPLRAELSAQQPTAAWWSPGWLGDDGQALLTRLRTETSAAWSAALDAERVKAEAVITQWNDFAQQQGTWLASAAVSSASDSGHPAGGGDVAGRDRRADGVVAELPGPAAHRRGQRPAGQARRRAEVGRWPPGGAGQRAPPRRRRGERQPRARQRRAPRGHARRPDRRRRQHRRHRHRRAAAARAGDAAVARQPQQPGLRPGAAAAVERRPGGGGGDAARGLAGGAAVGHRRAVPRRPDRRPAQRRLRRDRDRSRGRSPPSSPPTSAATPRERAR